jgi:type IV secretion system protein VirB4
VELWTRAPRDQYFDSGVDTVSSAKYVYFELEGIEDDPLLAKPFVSALMGVIWNRITNPSALQERKAVIIDEAWSFLADPSFFAMAEMMFRTIRKFNGFVVLSTQTPNDIQNGEARKLLQTMAEMFLYKGFSEPTFFSDDLGLSEHQRRLHEGLQQDERRREVLYWNRRGHVRVLSVEIAPAAYWFATTDAEDKAYRTAFFRRFGMVEGTRHLVAACEGRTIAGKELRLRVVGEYANAHKIA